jgi:hypothetical protein
MADREMIAATLAAALIVGRNSSSTRTSVELLAVQTYQRVLAACGACPATINSVGRSNARLLSHDRPVQEITARSSSA